MMCCTEVDGSNSPFGGDSRFAHNFARFHPCGSIGNFARRIQILDDIIVFQQFTRFVGCHDYLPRSGIISHHIYGAIHYRSQRVLLIGGDEVFGQAPVVYIRICQCGPFAIREFKRKGTFHRMFDIIDIQAFEESLCPLFSPCFCACR